MDALPDEALTPAERRCLAADIHGLYSACFDRVNKQASVECLAKIARTDTFFEDCDPEGDPWTYVHATGKDAAALKAQQRATLTLRLFLPEVNVSLGGSVDLCNISSVGEVKNHLSAADGPGQDSCADAHAQLQALLKLAAKDARFGGEPVGGSSQRPASMSIGVASRMLVRQ